MPHTRALTHYHTLLVARVRRYRLSHSPRTLPVTLTLTHIPCPPLHLRQVVCDETDTAAILADLETKTNKLVRVVVSVFVCRVRLRPRTRVSTLPLVSVRR